MSKHLTCERIYDDLAAEIISARTPRPDIFRRYGRPPDPESCWLDYKVALRARGEDHGTIVLIDHTRDILIGSMDCDGDTTKDEVIARLGPLAQRHIDSLGGWRTTVMFFRLPRGDYSGETFDFFWDRGQLMWEATRGRERIPA